MEAGLGTSLESPGLRDLGHLKETPMDPRAVWLQELDHPTSGFFPALAARLREPDGLRVALCEAVEHLTPRVDWEGHLPQMPHGLLGLRAVLRLEPHLSKASFHRLLATQLHAFAAEGRAPTGHGLLRVSRGSGDRPNMRMALRDHHPALFWGEAMALAEPSVTDFAEIPHRLANDMANVGHKAVVAHHLADLFELLGRPKAAGRCLLGLAGWVGASEPSDFFWHARARKRLEGAEISLEPAPPKLTLELHVQAAQELCESGLVAMLDGFTKLMKAGATEDDLLAILVLAASEKQLDARRDLEGKTAWNFVYLALLPALEAPETWLQAAALVNFFPTDDEETRVKGEHPLEEPADPFGAAMDAILDAEPARAMGLMSLLWRREGDAGALGALAEAASRNDPATNHSHQALAVAAAVDLVPFLTEPAKACLFEALAKFLANSQGSDDLGRAADRALENPVR